MRTPAAAFVSAAALALAACSSGSTRVIYVQSPAPAAAPKPAPIAPLEVTLGRPVRGKVVVQTNRPAYVALFEIVPGRGVTLVRPASAPQRLFVVSGMRTMPVWWSTKLTPANAQLTRYVYAVASDQQLIIPDEAFEPGYLQRTLGTAVYRATSPYETMRALSRHFVPRVVDERWAEDAYQMTYASQTTQPTARVYCADGTMYEIPADLVQRALCPPRVATAEPGAPRREPTRPDSAFDNNGRRVPGRGRGGEGRGPIDRVEEGTVAGNNGRGPQGGFIDKGPKGKPDKEKPDNNGRAVGHGNPAPGVPVPPGRAIGLKGRDTVPANPAEVGKKNGKDDVEYAARHEPRPADTRPAHPAARPVPGFPGRRPVAPATPRDEQDRPNAGPKHDEPKGDSHADERAKAEEKARADERAQADERGRAEEKARAEEREKERAKAEAKERADAEERGRAEQQARAEEKARADEKSRAEEKARADAEEREARAREERERDAREREAKEREARDREARDREAQEREAQEREAREKAEQRAKDEKKDDAKGDRGKP